MNVHSLLPIHLLKGIFSCFLILVIMNKAALHTHMQFLCMNIGFQMNEEIQESGCCSIWYLAHSQRFLVQHQGTAFNMAISYICKVCRSVVIYKLSPKMAFSFCITTDKGFHLHLLGIWFVFSFFKPL